MISQEYSTTLFNPITFHDPYFDRVSSSEEFTGQGNKMMFGSDSTSSTTTSNFPPNYPVFRRMSADTQASSADSSSAPYSSPDHKPIINNNGSVVLPPIHDLPRSNSPQTSDTSSRSPQWQQQQHQQQQQQYAQHHHYSPPHHQSPAYNFPPIDQHSRRPQLHINPSSDQRGGHQHVASYPTPTTASTMSNSGYSSSGYYQQQQRAPIPAPAPAPPPPVVTPATLAAAVGTQQRRRGKLPKPVTEFLKKWLLAHTDHPYPTEDEKKWLCSETGLSMSQVSNWMINARRRILAPAAKNAAAAAAAAQSVSVASTPSQNPYYSRSPPVRTVSGSSNSDAPGSGGYPLNGHGYHHHSRRESAYAPYPSASSRMANNNGHHYSSSPATPSYPSPAAPPLYTSSAAAAAYHYSGGSSAPSQQQPPALVAPYASSTLAPFGDGSHDGNTGSERTKSPAGDFAYAPQ